MRRLDLHPKRKLRNPRRHLRSLARWPEQIVAQLPTAEELSGAAFWNFRIPVYSKLVHPPHTRSDWQASALGVLFAAAEAIERSPRKPAGVRVACLVNTPWLFESEVTLFADEDYFRSFLPQAKPSRSEWEGGWVAGRAATVDEIPDWAPPPPDGLRFRGGTLITEGDHPLAGDITPAERSRFLWVWAFERGA